MEILVPAGGSSGLVAKLIKHGADAIYFGVRPPTAADQRYSLLPTSVEYELGAALDIIQMIKDAGRRCYITLNCFYHDRQLPAVVDLAQQLYEAGADAMIVADAGLAALIKQARTGAEIHVSILGRTMNRETAAFWKQIGASRIILERTISLEEAFRIKNSVGVEIELFVYGGFCFNYHGMCRLSSYLYGEMCLAPCRDAIEIERMPKAGKTPMRSKWLNAYGLLDQMYRGGVDCIKVEGRQKTGRNTIEVLKVLRRAVDVLKAGDPLPKLSAKNIFFLAPPLSTPGFYDPDVEILSTLENNGGLREQMLGLLPYLSVRGLSFALDRNRKVKRAIRNADRPSAG